MAATIERSTQAVDELLFHNDSVSLCLLVNRRHKTLRVIDFRAGPTVAKRNFVIATAKREGVEKVFVLVERDEVNTWMRLGLRREGNIPGFYKRSDAWIMGAVVAEVGPIRAEDVYDDDELDTEFDEPSSAVDMAQKTIEKAKKLVKEGGQKSQPITKLAVIKKDVVKKVIASATIAGRALSGFEPFSRDAVRVNVVVSGRGGFELPCSYEIQPSFGSSMFDILVAPRDENERLLTQSALATLGSNMVEAGAASTFTILPSDDVQLTGAMLGAGFRKSGVLSSHLSVGGKRKDGIIWSKRLVGDN
jgi:hypothetical protein